MHLKNMGWVENANWQRKIINNIQTHNKFYIGSPEESAKCRMSVEELLTITFLVNRECDEGNLWVIHREVSNCGFTASLRGSIEQIDVDIYLAKIHLEEHVLAFKERMDAMRIKESNDPEAVICRAFMSTLKGDALAWFKSLSYSSVGYWFGFNQLFIQEFAGQDEEIELEVRRWFRDEELSRWRMNL